jgi:hypothetical protein
MERVILLKTQLAEAAKLACSADFAHQRLAVILLDNFAEIQLSTLIKRLFFFDEGHAGVPKKYGYAIRKKLLYNYDDLVKACASENIITSEERELLIFCHNVRNNLYHQAAEEHLLTTIALQFLHGLILKYQSEWRSARDFTSWSRDTKDPYQLNDGGFLMRDTNTREEWLLFLKKYFDFAPAGGRTASALITEHLLNKIETAREHYQFLLDEYGIFSPGSAHWELNEFVLFYSFFNVKDFELKNLKANGDMAQYNTGYLQMMQEYKANWNFIRPERLSKLEKSIKALEALTAPKALGKFQSYKTEVYMIYNALSRAVGDLEVEIEAATERMNESRY